MKIEVQIKSLGLTGDDTYPYIIKGNRSFVLVLLRSEWDALCASLDHKVSVGDVIELTIPGEIGEAS